MSTIQETGMVKGSNDVEITQTEDNSHTEASHNVTYVTNIHNGVSPEVMLGMMDKMVEHRTSASKIAKLQADKYNEEHLKPAIMQDIMEENPELVQPDTQFMMEQSVKIGASTNSPEIHETLSQIIKQRLAAKSGDEKSLSLKQALDVMPYLNKNHLKYLAFLVGISLQYRPHHLNKEIDVLDEIIDGLEILENTPQHLQSIGLLENNMFQNSTNNYYRLIASHVPYIVTADDIDMLPPNTAEIGKPLNLYIIFDILYDNGLQMGDVPFYFAEEIKNTLKEKIIGTFNPYLTGDTELAETAPKILRMLCNKKLIRSISTLGREVGILVCVNASMEIDTSALYKQSYKV
jgi:hypothetical protein